MGEGKVLLSLKTGNERYINTLIIIVVKSQIESCLEARDCSVHHAVGRQMVDDEAKVLVGVIED